MGQCHDPPAIQKIIFSQDKVESITLNIILKKQLFHILVGTIYSQYLSCIDFFVLELETIFVSLLGDSTCVFFPILPAREDTYIFFLYDLQLIPFIFLETLEPFL